MSTYLDTVISDVLRETLLYLPLSDISTIHKVIGHNRSYFRDDHFWKDYWYATLILKRESELSQSKSTHFSRIGSPFQYVDLRNF